MTHKMHVFKAGGNKRIRQHVVDNGILALKKEKCILQSVISV